MKTSNKKVWSYEFLDHQQALDDLNNALCEGKPEKDYFLAFKKTYKELKKNFKDGEFLNIDVEF